MRQLNFSKQYGNGVFIGNRYQKGNGFFGKLIKNALFPLLKYIGKQGIKTAVAIGEEAVKNPNQKFKTIVKSKLKDAGMTAIDDSIERVKKYVQTGKGIKRKGENIKGIDAKKSNEDMKIIKSRRSKVSKPKTVSKRKPKRNNSKRTKAKSFKKGKAIKGRKKSKKQAFPFLKKDGSPTH